MSYYGSPMEEEIIRIVRFWRGQVVQAYIWGGLAGFGVGLLVMCWRRSTKTHYPVQPRGLHYEWGCP